MRNKNTILFLTMLVVICVLPVTILVISKPVVDPNTIVLTSSNLLVLNAEVDGESEGSVLSQAKALDRKSSDEPLYLYLQTPGGSVQAGTEMIEALTGMGRPVHTITAFAASMGFHLAQNLGTRYILASGVLMSHRARGGVEGSFGGSEPSQMQSRYSLMQRQMLAMDQQVVKRTKGKQTLASYQKSFDNELYVTGQEAVNQGYADKVIKVKCDSSLNGTTPMSAVMGGFKVDYEIDNCPLNSNPRNVQVQMNTTQGFMTEQKFLKSGGSYGVWCLQQAAHDKRMLCATDTSMTADTLPSIRRSFLLNYEKSRASVIPMGL